MNNPPNPPLNVDLGDGARLVEGVGDSWEVIEADGKRSVAIQVGATGGKPFRVRHWKTNQEVLDATGKILAKTTDPEMAQHICFLLIAYKNIQDRKAGT